MKIANAEINTTLGSAKSITRQAIPHLSVSSERIKVVVSSVVISSLIPDGPHAITKVVTSTNIDFRG